MQYQNQKVEQRIYATGDVRIENHVRRINADSLFGVVIGAIGAMCAVALAVSFIGHVVGLATKWLRAHQTELIIGGGVILLVVAYPYLRRFKRARTVIEVQAEPVTEQEIILLNRHHENRLEEGRRYPPITIHGVSAADTVPANQPNKR